MPRRTTITRLFEKGLVTDVDPLDSGLESATVLQDAVWNKNGDLAKRGGLMYATATNPLNARTQGLTGCLYYNSEVVPALRDSTLVLTDDGGHIGKIGSYSYTHGAPTTDTTSATLSLTSSPVWPVTVWDGEIIVTRPTTYNAMFRWAGATAAASASAGTVTVTDGSDVVTGSGTAFTTEYTDGQYLVVTDSTGVTWYLLVRAVQSDTVLTLTSPAAFTGAGMAATFLSYGHFNLCSEVTTRGTVSSSSTTVTGVGTGWATVPDAPLAGDVIGVPADGATSGSPRHQFNATPTATSGTLTAAPSSAWSSDYYVAARRFTGSIVTPHAGRLWVAGHHAFPNRLQVTPAGFRLNDAWNGVDSTTTDPIRACIAESIDIPTGEPAEGRIVALASMNEPGPLLILRDRDAYILYGEWPSVQVTKLGDELGCLHWGAVTTMDGAAYWAGPDGVYVYRPGGGVRELTRGRIRRDYLNLVRGLDTVPPINTTERTPVIVTAVDNHVIIMVGDTADPTSSTTYVYDVVGDRWVEWTGVTARGAQRAAFPDRSYEAFVVDPVLNVVVGLSTALEGDFHPDGYMIDGAFRAQGALSVTSTGDVLGRVTDAKLTYRLNGTSSPAFTVKFGREVAQFVEQTISTVATGDAYGFTRFRPGSLVMGQLHRAMRWEFVESAGTVTQLELNQFSYTTRERRGRA